MEKRYQDNQTVQYVIARTHASQLARWDKSLPIADKWLHETQEQTSVFNWIYVYYYIANADWKNAKLKFEYTPVEISDRVVIKQIL